MSLIVFSVPLMIEANVEAEAAKSEVEEAAKRDAEKDAIIDAQRDAEILKWFTAGLCASTTPLAALSVYIWRGSPHAIALQSCHLDERV